LKAFSNTVSCCLLLACVVAAQEPPPGAADFIRGQQAMRERDTDSAIEAFSRALSANPDLSLSHYYLGYAYQSHHDWENAGTHFALFLSLAQEDDPVATQIVFHAKRQGGLALARTDNPARAAAFLEPIVDADPDDADAHFYLGVAKLAEGDRDLARSLFDRVLSLDRANAEAYYYVGRIASEDGGDDLARRRLRRFVGLKPHSAYAANAYLLLGRLSVRAGDTAAAIADFEKCLALDPTGDDAAAAQQSLRELRPSGDPPGAREEP